MDIRKIINYLSYPITKYKYKNKWRKENSHNFTIAGNSQVLGKTKVGNYSYGVINVQYRSGKLYIGSFCSISDNVTFITGGEHFTKHLSSFPFNTYFMNRYEPGGSTKGDIIIEDDVWIGYGAIILSGVRVGQGAVIGANTVVAKDVPPYAVYANDRIVKYRFSDDIIEKMIMFDYGSLTKEEIVDNIDFLYSDIDEKFFESSFYKMHLRNITQT